MKLKTRGFEFCNGKYANLADLAQVMGISVSQIYLNEKFITGALKAFPGYKLNDLFYVAPEAKSSNKLPEFREYTR